jgi:hypothetical protein
LQVNITFGEKANRQVEKKEVPLWISESTVHTREEEETSLAIGPSMAMLEVSNNLVMEVGIVASVDCREHSPHQGGGGSCFYDQHMELGTLFIYFWRAEKYVYKSFFSPGSTGMQLF